jgi:ubiquinone/menaquinone biosynthesis C-methylase UbiE
MENIDYKNIIDYYFSKKKSSDDDYNLILEDEVDIQIINPNTGDIIVERTKEVKTRMNLYNLGNNVLSQEEIDKMSPDNIDNEGFWKYAVKKFPNFSISNYENCRTEDDVNKANLNAATWIGFIQKIESLIKIDPDEKHLEIGPGYGGLFRYILKRYENCNYYAIDINPLFYYEGGLYKCDGKTIPNELGNEFKTIFSYNVFQHLSKSQRSSYYNECYNKLQDGGKFIFTNFLVVEQNKDKKFLWSYVDEKNRPYTNFFTQMNAIDYFEELADELNDIGFDVKVSLKQNIALLECTKHNFKKNG